MKIIVLDGFTLNPGDLSWKSLAQVGDLKVYDRTINSTKEIIKAIGDAEIIFTNKTLLMKEVLVHVPHVKYIGVLATGYNVVDIVTANKLNITVTNIPSYGTNVVAQFVMGLLLEMCLQIGSHDRTVKNGDWVNAIDFCYWNSPMIELEGKTIGLIGFGKIGKATAKLAAAFGMQVLVYSRTMYPKFENDTLKFVDLNTLLLNSDIISLHCPLNSATKMLINKESIQKMKTGVMLINSSRGGLIDEQDLKDALDIGKVAMAAVDVVSIEPMIKSNPLMKAKNCIITPHIAWATKEARQRLLDTAVQNLKFYLSGKSRNVVC